MRFFLYKNRRNYILLSSNPRYVNVFVKQVKRNGRVCIYIYRYRCKRTSERSRLKSDSYFIERKKEKER